MPEKRSTGGRRFGSGAADVTYVLDESDRVFPEGPGWDRFALENGAPSLVGAAGVGLWDSIADATVAYLWQELVERVRRDRVTLSVPFRCDAPDLSRWFEMRLSAGAGNTVRFESHLVYEQQHAGVDTGASSTADVGKAALGLLVCSWCKKAHTGGAWVELEQALTVARTLEHAAPPLVSHGICDSCRADLEERLTDELGSA